MQHLSRETLAIQEVVLHDKHEEKGRGKQNYDDKDGQSVEDMLNDLLEEEQEEEDNQKDAGHDNLFKLNVLQLGIRERIQSHRSQIVSLHEQIAAAQSLDRMSQAQEGITELFTQIHHLRAGATESEIIVREITRDIKNLDLAKKNIVSSITGIKRFQMLVVAFDQLKRQAKGKKYRESAQALSAVKELAKHFRSFSSIDRIASVLNEIQDIQGVMRTQIMKDFDKMLGRGKDNLVTNGSDGTQILALTDACLVIDAIGSETRQALLEWYCNLQLQDYRRIFRPSEEAGQLDNLSRRFAWFRRALKTFEEGEQGKIFPKEWNVQACLAGSFAAVTKDDLKSVLVRVASGLNVTRLLESLNITTEFEAEISRKLGMPIATFSVFTHGSSVISISSAFEPYLGIFVDAQDRSLSEMIQTWRTRKTSFEVSTNSKASLPGGIASTSTGDSEESGPSSVLPSSTELFYFYRETLERCAQLNNRTTFLELCGVYRKWLKVYAEEVLGGFLSKSERRSTEGRLNTPEIVQACTVLNTAEYCAETTAQLEERLKRKIHKDFKERVSLEAEKDLFTIVISTSILSLLKELEINLEPSLNTILRSPWREATIVSSESPYIHEMASSISKVADIVKTEIEHRKYYRSFCDKVVGLVVMRFTQAVVRARPISPVGAEQILLDLQRLKSCLLQLPKLAGDGAGSSTTTLASYNRVVAKSMGKVDIMLQVIMCPDDPPEAFVDLYLVLIPCQSFSDFQKMLDLKGVRRTEQNNLLDLFLAKTSTLKDLQDTSFLTSIDMDGHGISQGGSGGSHLKGAIGSTAGVGQTGTGGGIGLGFPGITPTSPNSALAHNFNLFMSSLPMLQTVSAASGVSTRAGTPQLGYTGSSQGQGFTGLGATGSGHQITSGPGYSLGGGFGTAEGRPFGFKQIGRLFSKDIIHSG